MAVRIDWDRLRHVKFANVNTPPEWPLWVKPISTERA
jgi:hypothetical protein